MQLSEHDLEQLDEQRLLGLPMEALRNVSLKLLADLKEARDRLNQKPRACPAFVSEGSRSVQGLDFCQSKSQDLLML